MSANHHGIDYSALSNFRYEIRRFLNFSENAARAAGIEPQQHQALLALKGLPEALPATVGALAERLQIRHNSAVGLSRRLEAKKLIKRTRNDSDAREVLLRITPKGERLLERLSLVHRQELRTAGLRLIEACILSLPAPQTARVKTLPRNGRREGNPI